MDRQTAGQAEATKVSLGERDLKRKFPSSTTRTKQGAQLYPAVGSAPAAARSTTPVSSPKPNAKRLGKKRLPSLPKGKES